MTIIGVGIFSSLQFQIIQCNDFRDQHNKYLGGIRTYIGPCISVCISYVFAIVPSGSNNKFIELDLFSCLFLIAIEPVYL